MRAEEAKRVTKNKCFSSFFLEVDGKLKTPPTTTTITIIILTNVEKKKGKFT